MHGRLPGPPPGPDPFAGGLPVLDGVPHGGHPPRLRLRPTRADDAEDVYAVFSDLETVRYWSHEPFTGLDQARDYLAGIERVFGERTLFQWAVADAETDRLIGTVTLFGWDRAHRRAEVGFILHRARWGQGLASEAVRAALAFAFGPMGLHRVEADVDPDNGASLALLRRIGFREEGRLRERWFTYGEWRGSVLLGLLSGEESSPEAVTRR